MGMRLSTSSTSTSTSTGTRTGGSGTGTGTRTRGSGTSTGTGTGTGTGTRTGGRGTSTGTGTRTGGSSISTGTRTGGSSTSIGTGTGTRTGGSSTSIGTGTGTRTGGSSTSIGTGTGTRTGGSGKSTPIVREFVKVEGGGNAKGQGDAIRFRLVSYNILAQVYVKNHGHFTHSPSPCLRWEARSQQILTLLKNLGADFYSLQELDEYDSFYKKSMEGLGYSSIYVQRSGQKRDGCGIFYKKDRAQLLLEEKIEYNDLVSSEHDKASSSSDKRKAPQTNRNNRDAPNQESTPQHRGESDFKKDCVGIMAAFKLKHPFHHVLVLANTHLHWDPKLAYVKLAQAKYLLARLAKFKEHVAKRFHCTPSVMLCGDFNSTPGDKVYQYLVSGNTLSTSSERCSEPEGLPLPLCSVYASGRRREPRFTTCTPKFKNTIDYVFFSPSHCLKPVSILQLPELDSADVAGGLPNHSHPSDHMPIGAEFEITKH